MKTNKLINILLSGLLVAFSFSSCTDDFQDINTNKRVLAEVDIATIGNIFAYQQYMSLELSGSFQIFQNLFSDLYVQYYANWQQAFQTDRNVINVDWLNAAWNTWYSAGATNLAVVMEKTNPKYVEGMEQFYAIAQVWKVFIYQRVTDYYGPIPYSAVNSAAKSIPYDSQESIYADFIVQLDSATTTLAGYTGKNAFGSNDQVFGGDINKWITFANTLRLRVAMRMSDIDPVTAKAQAEKAVAAGVMLTNADNGLFKTSATGYNALCIMLPWNEFRMSATMESYLKGYADPRLSKYFQPAFNTPGVYKGMRNGCSIVQLSEASRHYNALSTMSNRWAIESNKNVTPIEVILCSEAYFTRAEGALKGWSMGGTAEELYNKGIEASLSYWGVSATDIATYQAGTTSPVPVSDFDSPAVATIPVKYDAATALEQIITQKWLALFPDGWEAWANLRKTEFPKLYPVMNSDNPDVPPGQIIRRVQYGPSEYGNNKAAVTAAVATLPGGLDKSNVRVWWNPAK